MKIGSDLRGVRREIDTRKKCFKACRLGRGEIVTAPRGQGGSGKIVVTTELTGGKRRFVYWS